MVTKIQHFFGFLRQSRQIYFILFVSIIISLIWFRRGLLFATSEEGPIFYSLLRTYNIYSDIWIRYGIGFVYSGGLPVALTALFLSPLSVVLSNVEIQFLVFLFLIFSGITGTFCVTKKITSNKYVALLAGLFYFFNTYSMTQVWRRSLFVGMFAWAYLPIFLLILVKWLEEGRIKTLCLFVVTNFVFLWVFENPAYAFSFAAIAAISVLFKLSFDKTHKLIFLIRSLVIFIVFIAINLWWMYPYIKTLNATYSSPVNSSSLDSLRGVSKFFSIGDIVTLRQKYYFETESNKQMPLSSWGTWYETYTPKIISFGIFAICLYGIWRWRRKKYFGLLVLLFIVAFFIVKGSNPPFGNTFYKWAFDSLPFSSALRNPYEKFGITWLLPYSIFFAIGTYNILDKLKKNRRIIFGSILLLSVYVVLVWPFWTGKLFEDYEWVKFPSYYQDLDNFLKNKTLSSRVAVVPLIPDYYINYQWGYKGIEPSEFMLSGTTFSKRLDYDSYTNVYNGLKNALETGDLIEESLDNLNIKYLVLRNDVNLKDVGSYDPSKLRLTISNIPYIKYIQKFGDLELYENTKSKDGFITVDGNALVTYKMLSVRKYEVTIRNAQEPFVLIFKESFDPNWTASVNGVPIDNHNMVYNYANAWRLNKLGDYQITIIYKIWPWE